MDRSGKYLMIYHYETGIPLHPYIVPDEERRFYRPVISSRSGKAIWYNDIRRRSRSSSVE
jgi:hypothetical protein